MSADDRRGPMVKILEGFAACKNLAARMDHSFYYHPILEQAIDQFKTPEGLEGLDADRFDLARAGLRLLATLSDPDTRRRGYASRLARNTKNFDARLAWLNSEKDRRDKT